MRRSRDTNARRIGALAAALSLASLTTSLGSAQESAPVPKVSPAGRSLSFDFPQMRVGVAEYDEGPTGTTVFYFPAGVKGAVDVRGESATGFANWRTPGKVARSARSAPPRRTAFEGDGLHATMKGDGRIYFDRDRACRLAAAHDDLFIIEAPARDVLCFEESGGRVTGLTLNPGSWAVAARHRS